MVLKPSVFTSCWTEQNLRDGAEGWLRLGPIIPHDTIRSLFPMLYKTTLEESILSVSHTLRMVPSHGLDSHIVVYYPSRGYTLHRFRVTRVIEFVKPAVQHKIGWQGVEDNVLAPQGATPTVWTPRNVCYRRGQEALASPLLPDFPLTGRDADSGTESRAA